MLKCHSSVTTHVWTVLVYTQVKLCQVEMIKLANAVFLIFVFNRCHLKNTNIH